MTRSTGRRGLARVEEQQQRSQIWRHLYHPEGGATSSVGPDPTAAGSEAQIRWRALSPRWIYALSWRWIQWRAVLTSGGAHVRIL